MITSWNDADNELREIAKIDIKIAEAEAAKAAAVLSAQSEFDRKAKPLAATRECRVKELEAYYKRNRKAVEVDGKRSIELTFGKLGMRKGNPTLALLKGWKWDKVLAEVKDMFAKKPDVLKALITTKESCNKDGIKAREGLDLAAIGLKITQDDEFYFETFTDKVKVSPGAPAAA